MYSYWRYNSNREFQGLTGYRLEPRYRLRFPNTRFGAYLGLYGRVGDYDSMTIDNSQPVNDNSNTNAQPTTGYQLSTVNYTGDDWDAGLSAGFTVRLVGGLGLEVGARGGYVRSSPEKYIHRNGQKWFDSRWKYDRVGVTELNVSLIYTIQPHPGPLPRRGR
jgi:hypothetical protein